MPKDLERTIAIRSSVFSAMTESNCSITDVLQLDQQQLADLAGGLLEVLIQRELNNTADVSAPTFYEVLAVLCTISNAATWQQTAG